MLSHKPGTDYSFAQLLSAYHADPRKSPMPSPRLVFTKPVQAAKKL